MSRRNIYIVVGLLLVLLVAGYWFLLLSPLRAEIGTVEENITREQQELTVARTKLAQLEGIRKRAEKNRGRILELGRCFLRSRRSPAYSCRFRTLQSNLVLASCPSLPMWGTQKEEYRGPTSR